MTELTRTINNVNDLSTAQSDISSLQESVNTNTIVGNLEGALPYTITSGSNNTFIGFNAGVSCEQGSNNTFVGASIQLQPGQTLFNGSIALGAGTIVTNSDKFVVASNINSFIIPGLTQSTGSGEGIILEYNSSGNIIPSTGTYSTVSKIDTELSSLQSSVNTNTSDINTLLSGGTLFTMLGSYTVPSNVTTLSIEAIGGGGGGAGSGSGSSSRCLQGQGGPVCH